MSRLSWLHFGGTCIRCVSPLEGCDRNIRSGIGALKGMWLPNHVAMSAQITYTAFNRFLGRNSSPFHVGRWVSRVCFPHWVPTGPSTLSDWLASNGHGKEVDLGSRHTVHGQTPEGGWMQSLGRVSPNQKTGALIHTL